jgi:hypothetical protein
MSHKPSYIAVPSPIIALVAWLVPGAGYWLLGQRARALTITLTIFTLYFIGILVGGVRVVDPPVSYSHPQRIIFDKPWFMGQILAGPVTLVVASIGTPNPAASSPSEFYESHARLYEIGTLYTAVAGMLNLLAIIDSAYRASHTGERA